MVSRRKILGRSQDNLNVDLPYGEEEEDVWYKMDKLYKVRQRGGVYRKKREERGGG